MQEKKKTLLHFMTAKGISKTFLYSYNIITIIVAIKKYNNVIFHYNVISLNIHLPGPDSLLLE